MPVHDWSNVPPGLFHHFHQFWATTVCTALNSGGLPKGAFAMIGPGDASPDSDSPTADGAEEDVYAARASRVIVRSAARRVVSVVELVSPGLKYNNRSWIALAERAFDLLREGVNVLVIDLFPDSRRNSPWVHNRFGGQAPEGGVTLPPDKPLMLASYSAGPSWGVYLEPVAVGDVLPEMPLFIDPERYVQAPLEQSYESAWALCPTEFREAVLEFGRG